MAEDTQPEGGDVLEVPKKENDPILAEINKRYNIAQFPAVAHCCCFSSGKTRVILDR